MDSSKLVVGTSDQGKAAENDGQGEEYLKNEEWKSMSLENEKKKDSWFESTFRTLYGDLSGQDRERACWLGGTLFFIVGGYWLLRSLKDPVMSTICGVEYIPKAKMVSLVVVTGCVTVYNKLIDIFPTHQLFYLVGGFYFISFSLIALALTHPTMGLANTEASPTRLLGWISYCTIESFGSIGVSLFWAFCNYAMDIEQAKSAYGLIVAGAQIGAIMGPTVVTNAEQLGVPLCYFVGALCMATMSGIVYLYTKKFGVAESSLSKEVDKKKSGGMFEGIQLFINYNYVKGIFAISCLFMIEVTILDYTMKVLAKDEFDSLFPNDQQQSTRAFVAFMGRFGQATNTLSFGSSLLGTSFIIRHLGLQKTVIAFPLGCLLAIILVYLVPTLWAVFAAMLLLKAFSYSLNNPCKEILYQVTSKSVKFKAKSWIDVFGARGSKAAGSVITNAWSDSAADLLNYGSFFSMGISVFLIYVSYYMGLKFDEHLATGHVIGEDQATNEEEEEGTSCGIETHDSEQSEVQQEEQRISV